MRRLLLCVALLATAELAAADGAYMPSIAMGDVVIPMTSLKQSRTGRTLIQKYDFSCGSAALATLLTHHYGFPVTEETVFQQMYEHGDQKKIHTEGFSLLDMKRYLEAQGFEADGFEQPLEKLNEARVPAIVLINSDGYHHFVVVKGVQADRVLVGDPALGTRAMSRQAFDKVWQNGLLFVIHNRMESARFNVAADWRAAPRAPVDTSMARNAMTDLSLPKLGPGDF
ncbi:C39 family peptidase [Variovorax sp. J31P207]|uniref:C39 family peptidase n=1 Tax=Variovorax sp. J31P207 TaxID=3053510 RepID=UPI002577AE11|nr:C39 family peptidase [Variovorax sp. J31P207]MDM0067966.1 C39 family peptidase [Variovorax sp. J31P207]